MPTERENIATIQAALATIKRIAQEEKTRALSDKNPELLLAWNKVFHSTGTHHNYLTDLLNANFPEFSAEVVLMGPGGR